MPYEIPSQLQYSEKIIFGLDFKQLTYATIFGLLDFAIFFKTPWSITIKVSLMIVPTMLAVGFMFFDLDRFAFNIYHWLRFRGTENMQKYIGVKEVDEYIHTDKKVAVIQVFPINFNIKTHDEKDTITRQFLKFVNAIDFPVQILMQTKDLDIKQYLSKLTAPTQYKELFEKNKKFLLKLIHERKVHDRAFYLVVKEQDKLSIQVEICCDWLRTLGLQHKVLEKKELKELVTIKSQELVNSPSHLQIDNKFHRIIYAHGYPRMVEQGFLDKIVSCPGEFDFSLHINPYDVETMMVMINKELQKQKADLYSMNLKGTMSPSLEIKYNDTRRVLDELQKGNDKLFNISLYITCKANSLGELELLCRKVQSQLNALMIIPKIAMFQMDHGYKSMLPLAEDKLGLHRNITSKGLSAFFPWTSPFFQIEEKGVWLGLNKNGIPIIKDIFSLSNPNGVILAQSGGGKSYFAKLLISRYLLNGTRVMVIDPQGEYRNLVGKFGGERIDLSRTSDSIINPLDLMGHDYAEKRLALMDLMQVMLGGLTEPQRAFIDRALTKAYEKKGITNDPDSWDNSPPILGDLLKVLEQMEKKATQMEKMSIRSLINRLSIYVTGVFSFLNRETNIDFENNFVCFDIGDIPKPVKPTIMFLVLDYVYAKMKKDLDRKILLIDEAWSLLSRTEDASYIFEIVKTCRKFNMGLLLINQEVEGLLSSAAGKSVLANSAYTVLLKQKPAVITNICKTFHLSQFERDYILSASVGEGILLIDNEHFELKVVASPAEHKIITTQADELLEQKKAIVKSTKKKKVEIKADTSVSVHRKSKLSKEEVKFLIAKKFVEVTRKSICRSKKEKYLVKPRFNESESHLFVTYDIAEYLAKHKVESKLYVTKKPDVVFEIDGKKIAVEVETGTQSKRAARLSEKVKLLNEGYDHWFFVVTNRNNTPKYKKLGQVLELRYLKGHLDKLINYRHHIFKKNKVTSPRKSTKKKPK
jgi:conjugal transfer ATP-binding protein TraC